MKHSRVIEEKSKMRSQKSICTPVENTEKSKKKRTKGFINTFVCIPFALITTCKGMAPN